MQTGIERAVDVAGSQTKLAELLGVSKQAVQKWVDRGYAPQERVVEIEAQTGIPRKDLMDPRTVGLLDKPFGE